MRRRRGLVLALVAAIAIGFGGGASAGSGPDRQIAIVVHGGAGTIERSQMTPEKERAYREGLAEALKTGWTILERGGSSLDAVEATIRVLEDNPLFNAGKGAVFTSAGTIELDASIMEGATLKAGAVAGVKRVKNPISLARLVMERSRHLLFVGAGAESFAQEQGIKLVPNRYFWTAERWKNLQEVKRQELKQKRATARPAARAEAVPLRDADRFGTVGCVALDRTGTIVAGTSTGGMTNKRWGRVGDSPIIGAGTYADNRTCGVSATGTGEYFIRLSVARDIAALMEYKDMSVREAAERVIKEKLTKLGGDGGVVCLDRDGKIAMVMNTSGMYRGYVKSDGTIVTAIYADE